MKSDVLEETGTNRTLTSPGTQTGRGCVLAWGNACRLMATRKRIGLAKIVRRMRWLEFNDATYGIEFLESLLVMFRATMSVSGFRPREENIRTSTDKCRFLFPDEIAFVDAVRTTVGY